MRTLMLVTAWAAILVGAISVLGILSDEISAFEVFQDISKLWIGTIEPVISSIGTDRFGLSHQSKAGLWISAALPFVLGLILLLWPKPNN